MGVTERRDSSNWENSSAFSVKKEGRKNNEFGRRFIYLDFGHPEFLVNMG